MYLSISNVCISFGSSSTKACFDWIRSSLICMLGGCYSLSLSHIHGLVVLSSVLQYHVFLLDSSCIDFFLLHCPLKLPLSLTHTHSVLDRSIVHSLYVFPIPPSQKLSNCSLVSGGFIIH